MNPLLSIIIPVYKVEAYIEECLRSVLDKSVDSSQYEVIIVNDGDPGRSMEIVHGIVDGLSNVKIVEQENQGLSAARMNGLEKAEGEYVWFVDSDDYLLPGGLGKVLALLQADSGTDLFIFPAKWSFEDPSLDHLDMAAGKEYADAGKNLLRQKLYPQWLAQRLIVKRSLFDHPSLYFPAGRIHEDVYFSPVVGYLAKQARILSEPVYVYRIRGGSIMTSRGIRSSYDLLDIYRQLKDFQAEKVDRDDKPWFSEVLATALRECFRVSRFIFGTKEFKRFHAQNKKYVLEEYKRISSGFTYSRKLADRLLFKHPQLFQSIVQHRDKWKRDQREI